MMYAFEKLDVWQRAMELVENIYKLTQNFPKKEQDGLTSQLRRAAVSIPLNIVEGKGRYHQQEFVQFLYHARGSLYETVTLVQLSLRLHYLNQQENQEWLQLTREIMSKLTGLIHSLKT